MSLITTKHAEIIFAQLNEQDKNWFNKQKFIQKELENLIIPIQDNYKKIPSVFKDPDSNVEILNYFRDDFHFQVGLYNLIYFSKHFWPYSFNMINLLLGNNSYSKYYNKNIFKSIYIDSLWNKIPFSIDKTSNPSIYKNIELEKDKFIFLLKFMTSYIETNKKITLTKSIINKCQKIFSSNYLSKEILELLLINEKDSNKIHKLIITEINNIYNKELLKNILYHSVYLLIEMITESIFLEKKIYDHFYVLNGNNLNYKIQLLEVPTIVII